MNRLISAQFMGSTLMRTVLTIALLALFSTGTSRAQEVRKITFNEAVRIALEQNPSLKKVANQVELRSVAVSRERMNFFPDLTFSSSGGQNYGRNFIQHEGRVVNTTTEFVGLSAGTGVNLFNGFADVASLKQAQLQMDASELDYDRARQTVAFEVMQNFLLTISRREMIRVQEQNLEAQQKQLERIQAFTEVGARPISDLYQQQAEVANAELGVVNAQRSYQIAEANLIQILQLDPFQGYEFEAPPVDDVELTGQSYNMGEMLETAFDQRMDLKANQSIIAAARQGIRAARSGFWPQINMGASYGTNYSTAQTLGTWDQFDANRGGSVRFSLSVPIFDRFATRQGIQEARVQFENARLDLEELQQNVAVQVRQAYLDYLLTEKTLEVTEKQLQSAELALEAAQARYDVQAATLVEVTQANAAYVRAVTDRVNARYDFLFRSKLIDYYLGSLDPSEPLFE